MEERTLTGYPSVDKPWMKYYSEEAINAPLPEGSMYDYMTACNAGRMNEPALNYFGQKITHRQLQTEIDRCARALSACGVKAGDVVSLCLLAIPEAVYLLYAVNKLGAVANLLSPICTDEAIKEQILSTDSKLVIANDVIAGKVSEAKAVKPDIQIVTASNLFPLNCQSSVKSQLCARASALSNAQHNAAAECASELTVILPPMAFRCRSSSGAG